MKRKITERATTQDISGTLSQFTQRLTEWVEATVPSPYLKSVYVSLEREPEPYSDRDNAVIQVTWVRPETDEEEREREARENQSKAYRRQQYEQLKKEFG